MTTPITMNINLSEHDPEVVPKLAELGVLSWVAAAKHCLLVNGWTPAQVDKVFVPIAHAPGTNGHTPKPKTKPEQPTASFRGKRFPVPEDPSHFVSRWSDNSITLAELAQEFKLPVATLRRWASELKLPARARGRKVPAEA